MNHTAAVARWCALLASTSATAEEAARWRDLAERARQRIEQSHAKP